MIVRLQKTLGFSNSRDFCSLFFCAEGISQIGMLAFRFGAAREREKLAERVSHRFLKIIAWFL